MKFRWLMAGLVALTVAGPSRGATNLKTGLCLDYSNSETSGPRADSVSGKSLFPVNSPGTTVGPGGAGTLALLTDPTVPSSLARPDCAEWQGGACYHAWAVWARLDSWPGATTPNRFLVNKVGIPATGRWYREYSLSVNVSKVEWITADGLWDTSTHPATPLTIVDSPFPVGLGDWMLIIGEQYYDPATISHPNRIKLALSVRSQAHPAEVQTFGPIVNVTPLCTPGPANAGIWYAANPNYAGDFSWPGGIGPACHWKGRGPFTKAERDALWGGGVPADPNS